MRIFTDADADLGRLKRAKLALIGYGAQGEAHALNLRDSGVDGVRIALPPGSATRAKAEAEGFAVGAAAEAAAWADIVVMLAPDEAQPDIYAQAIAPHLRKDGVLLFAHGFAVHFGFITPEPTFEVALIAPKGPGRKLRGEFLAGRGLAGLIAVHQSPAGCARDIALAYAAGIGCGRIGLMETTFAEECETDLFGEQTVLCGGLVALVRAAYETLVDAGYAPEMAYFECLHEVKLIADLIYERGLAGIATSISNNAEYGGYQTGARLVTEATKAEMVAVLEDIRSGRFARAFMAEHAQGKPGFARARAAAQAHGIEPVGARLRAFARGAAQTRDPGTKTG
ncbi:MAG: ketol-acid reductoisomerase [Maricaulaceae bacterium]